MNLQRTLKALGGIGGVDMAKILCQVYLKWPIHCASQKCTTQVGGAQQSCTNEVVHNVAFTNPDGQTDATTRIISLVSQSIIN